MAEHFKCKTFFSLEDKCQNTRKKFKIKYLNPCLTSPKSNLSAYIVL